jgi:hypothetical protein
MALRADCLGHPSPAVTICCAERNKFFSVQLCANLVKLCVGLDYFDSSGTYQREAS